MTQTRSYPIAPAIKVHVTVGPTTLAWKQGIRSWSAPVEAVVGYAVKDRGKPQLGIVAGELLVRVEPQGGKAKTHRIPFDPTHAQAKSALDDLRGRCPDADLTGLPWPEAAARLEVKTKGWQDGIVSNGRIMVGLLLLAGAVGSGVVAGMVFGPPANQAEAIGRGAAQVIVAGVGISMMVTGSRSAKRVE